MDKIKLEKREMKRNRIIAIITMALLTLSMMTFWTPNASATPQHRIILPFHTSWENEQALGRTDAVDWKTSDFYNPECGWRNNEVIPPEVFGFDFGSRQLMVKGDFGSSYSYCYFNLFDTTPDSDFGPPIKLRPHTLINIWYYHYTLAHCMIDAKLYNKGTGQVWTLRDFNYNGQYIVDQNDVRIHPASRWNDPIGSWQFACFDLSIIYESDPENWYITKIWIGFDNDPSIGDGATGLAKTYFDLLHISYGKADVDTCTEGNDNAYTGGSITAWSHHLRPDGYYDLWLKTTISGFNDGYMTDWLGIDRNLYPLSLKVSVSNPDAQVLNDPKPSGVNLTEQGESPAVEFLADVTKTLVTYAYFPYDWWKDASELCQEFLDLTASPEPEPTYQWPEVQWLQPLYWAPQNYALGEVCILVPGLSPGTHSISVTFSVDYYWPDPAPFSEPWTPIYYETVSVVLNFEWSTEPDELPVSLSISTGTGGTTNPAPGTYTYDYGEVVTVTASAYSGYTFSYWILDGATKYDNPITVTMNSDHTLKAYFYYSGGGGGGGCPYVYAWNGERYMMDNNLLPASEISNGADVEDYYRLEQLLAPTHQGTRRSAYSLQIREFENEHDYFDQVKLLAVDYDSDVNIAVTPDGQILTYKEPEPPISCVDNNGENRLSQILRVDGNVSDPTTYYYGETGDYLILNFGKVNAENAKLILRDDMKSMIICIHVQILNDDGSWQTVAAVTPRDYWSTEAVDLSQYINKNEDFLVRLYWTSPHRLDYVGLDTSPQEKVELHQAQLISATHSVEGNVKPLLKENDGNYAELTPNQQITLTFLLPNNQNEERTFIFYIEGHYEIIA